MYKYMYIYKAYCTLNTSSSLRCTLSRLLKIIGLFCKRALQKRRHSAEETSSLRCTLYALPCTLSRLLKIIGLFCKRNLQKRRYSAIETYNFKEPTNRSHPISHVSFLMCHETHDERMICRIQSLYKRNYRSLLQKSPIKETIFCKSFLMCHGTHDEILSCAMTHEK